MIKKQILNIEWLKIIIRECFQNIIENICLKARRKKGGFDCLIRVIYAKGRDCIEV